MKRLGFGAVIVLLIVLFFAFGLHRELNFGRLKENLQVLTAWRETHPTQAIALYFLAYVLAAALSLPVVTVMTVAAGPLFGLWAGTLIVSFASAIGATLAMLSARYVLRDAIQHRFADRVKAIDAGVARDGAFYLFALRLVPVFPFVVVNLVMGLTRIPLRTYYLVSQIGMLPGTLVYVNLGTRLSEIDSLAGALSPMLLVSFALLGLLPLAARWALDALRARRVYRPWPKPSRFDYNMVVIGGGSAGLVSAYIGAASKAKVALVEAHAMGGDCLNTGCVPSKALIRSASVMRQFRDAGQLGLSSIAAKAASDAPGNAAADFPMIMDRVHQVIAQIEPHDSVARYTALGVSCLQGKATITSPWTVQVALPEGTRTLTTRSIVIATGARPTMLKIPGLIEAGALTSDTLWSLRTLPPRLIVLGGGPIGCELAQAFVRLGSQVTLVEMGERLMPREDVEISALIARRFEHEGIRVCTGHRAIEVRPAADSGEATAAGAAATQPAKAFELLVERVQAVGSAAADADAAPTAPISLPFDRIIVAVGRQPNTQGYGLEALGIGTTEQGTVQTDEALQTIYPNITACGDVAGPYQFTHVAAHQAWYASVNAMFGRFRRFKADYRVIPWATFTDPEVARVGLNEQEARAQGIAYELTVYGIDDLDRAIVDGQAEGMVKVLTPPGSDRILGVTLVGAHAGDLIAEFVLAMKHKLGLNQILGTIHIYPTWAEANKYAAGNWRKQQVTAGQQRLLTAVQALLRGEGGWMAALAMVPAALRKKPSTPQAAQAAHGSVGT